MNQPASSSARGYFNVTAAALLWGSSGVVGKTLFAQGVAPLALVQLRVTLASALLAGFLALRAPGLLRLRRRDLAYFALLGGVVMAGVQATYFFAISRIEVAAAILLQYTAPSLIAGFSVCFWRERATGVKLAGLVLSLAGAWLVVGGYDLELLGMNGAGIAAGLASAVTFAAYSLLGERAMHRYSPWTVLTYALVFATPTLHVVHRPFDYLLTPYTPHQWAGLTYVAVAGTLLPFGLYLVGVNHIRSTRASITATLEPITAGVLAFLLLGERLAPLELAGAGLVIGAVVLVNLTREHTHLAPAEVRAREAA